VHHPKKIFIVKPTNSGHIADALFAIAIGKNKPCDVVLVRVDDSVCFEVSESIYLAKVKRHRLLLCALCQGLQCAINNRTIFV
jgi:hypothetical protein